MSELLPIHALKAQIIQHALDMMHSAPHNFTEATAADVDALWDEMREDYPDTMQDAQNEVEDERADLLMQLKDTVAAWEKGDDVFGGIERARQLIAKLEA